MNTNNKEVLTLVRNFGFNHLFIGLSHDPNLCPECIKPHSLDNVVLQDNEDTEVQELPIHQWCNGCVNHPLKPSSKVEKLKEKLYKVEQRVFDQGASQATLLDTLELFKLLIENEE